MFSLQTTTVTTARTHTHTHTHTHTLNRAAYVLQTAARDVCVGDMRGVFRRGLLVAARMFLPDCLGFSQRPPSFSEGTNRIPNS